METTTRTENTQTSDYWSASTCGADVYLHVPTAEDALELAARFPKSLRVRATTLSYANAEGQWTRCGLVHLHVSTVANATTGEANEAGVKRLRSFFTHAARQGLRIPYLVDLYSNSLTTEQAADLAGLA